MFKENRGKFWNPPRLPLPRPTPAQPPPFQVECPLCTSAWWPDRSLLLNYRPPPPYLERPHRTGCSRCPLGRSESISLNSPCEKGQPAKPRLGVAPCPPPATSRHGHSSRRHPGSSGMTQVKPSLCLKPNAIPRAHCDVGADGHWPAPPE